MIDAWTQTSDRGSDNEEAIKQKRAQSSGNKAKHTLLQN